MPDFTDPEVKLMADIRQKWGAAISQACISSATAQTAGVRQDFMAAVIAGESAGDPNARRFEKAVFADLLLVCTGKKPQYSPAGIRHPLGAQDLLSFIVPWEQGGGQPQNGKPFSMAMASAADLATSWGLTQIMGWHAIEFSRPFSVLKTVPGQLEFTVQLLQWFAERYKLDLPTNDQALLCCWNTGRPDGQTFDPQYVANGLRRSAIYRTLP